jgi:hypothetical protein
MYVLSVFAMSEVRPLYQDTVTATFVVPRKVPMFCVRQYGFLPDTDAIALLNPLSNRALAQVAKRRIVKVMQPSHNP